MSRRLVLLALACGLVLAVPLWTSRYLPLVDLPQHLALTAILRHHGEPAWAFDRFYEVQWCELTPYWSYYLLLDGLALVLPLETASRVCLSLYALALPLVGLRLCQTLGAPPWAGLLMAPLALNANLYFGFVAYVMGVVLMLWLLAEYARLLAERTAWRGAAIALLSAVLFFTHVQPFVFLLAATVVLTFVTPTRQRLASLLVFAPATLGLFAPWAYLQFVGAREGVRGRYNFGTLGDLGARHRSLPQAAADLPSALAGSFQDGSDTVLLAVWATGVATLIVTGWRGRPRAPKRAAGPAELLFALAVAAYLVAPTAIRGQWSIAPRFAWIAALLAVAAMGDPGPALARAGRGLAVALTIATALNAAWKHRQFETEAAGFDEAVQAIPAGQRFLSLIHDPTSAVVTRWPYLHFGQYVLARRGGAAGHSLAKSPPFPVRHHRPEDFPAPDLFRAQDFRPSDQGAHYDYFLARGGPDTETLFAGPGPAPVLVYAAGGWRVWHNPSARPPR